MGTWLRASGHLSVIPEPDEKLMLDFWAFSQENCPEIYRRMDEWFGNPWYFDEKNHLTSSWGKFAECSIWLNYMIDEFFAPRGYSLIGDPKIIGEWESDLEDDSYECYKQWADRMKQLIHLGCKKEEVV